MRVIELGDFIGHILSELTISRTHADVQAIKAAESYQADSLLRHFPIPRFRLPTVVVTAPLAIQGVDRKNLGSHKDRIDLAQLESVTFRVTDQLLEKSIPKPPRNLHIVVKREINNQISQLRRLPSIQFSAYRFANNLAIALASAIRASSSKPSRDELNHLIDFEQQLREALVDELRHLEIPASRLSVLVTAQELREAGPAKLTIQLNVSEEAVEWTTIDSDVRSVDRLVPE